MKKVFSNSDIEVLNIEFIDITDKKIVEFDVATVRGSIRLCKGEVIYPDDVKSMKKKVAALKFPSK